MCGVGRVIGLFALTVVAACGGGGNDKSAAPATTATIHTTTTSPFVRPAPCINSMKAAADVFDAQGALNSNSGDLDNALVDVANAVGRDATRRAAAQAKVDAATQTDATLRSALTAAQAQLETLSAECTTELGARSLTAACQGVLEEARAIIASIQGLLANTDRSVELSRQTIAQFEKGNFEAGNKLIDQRNELFDAAVAGWDEVGPRVDNYDLRVDACTT
jgi:hypothetical protein